MTEPTLAWQQRAQQEQLEYSTYRAKYPIPHDGVIAYQPGHAVPISNVKKHGYDRDGLVERVDGQPLDAPLPDGYILEDLESSSAEAPGEGWNDGPGSEQAPAAPVPPQGQTVEVAGKPATGKSADQAQ